MTILLDTAIIHNIPTLTSGDAAQPACLKLNIHPAGHPITSQIESDTVEWFAVRLREECVLTDL